MDIMDKIYDTIIRIFEWFSDFLDKKEEEEAEAIAEAILEKAKEVGSITEYLKRLKQQFPDS